jgi:hypothetical protein
MNAHSGSNTPPSPSPNAADPMAGGKRSRWMAHVKKTMRANKGKSLSQVLKMAKKTYKKTRRGGSEDDVNGNGNGNGLTGGSVIVPLPIAGGRRRRGSRKGSKKGSRRH